MVILWASVTHTTNINDSFLTDILLHRTVSLIMLMMLTKEEEDENYYHEDKMNDHANNFLMLLTHYKFDIV